MLRVPDTVVLREFERMGKVARITINNSGKEEAFHFLLVLF